jgi:hypothetical protein
MNIPIGKRLSSLSKIDVDKYISDIENQINKSYSFLSNNDYKSASYDYGVYKTMISVLTKAFKSVEDLLSNYKRSLKYIKDNKSKIDDKIKEVVDNINIDGVKITRKDSLKKIRSDINRFNNNIEYDVILSADILEKILSELDDLKIAIQGDINRRKQE